MDCVDNPETGSKVSVDTAAARLSKCGEAGANTINFLGGEPTVNLPVILRILKVAKTDVPIVWNSNMYASKESLRIINTFADIFLADFKFGDDRCAERLAGVRRYVNVVKRNLLNLRDDTKLIVRHLPLKGHLRCCSLPIAHWLAENTPQASVSCIPTFVPNDYSRCAGVEFASESEFAALRAELKTLGLRDAWDVDRLNSFERKDAPSPRDMIGKTEIVIRKNGSVVFQDLNEELVNVVKSLEESNGSD